MTAPLHGIRILDFTELLAGPFLTQALVELGAEVVKIERPGSGDAARGMAPNLFRALNRGKISVALDLKDAAGRDQARAMAREADAVIESFRPGVMARLGLGADELRAENPRLVYLSIAGYGATGPLSQTTGHDLNFLAESGVASLCGTPGQPPSHAIGLPLADLGGALYGLSALLAAILQRNQTGRGQFLDLSLADCMAHWANPRRAAFAGEGITGLDRQREAVLQNPGYGVFACRDGSVAITALETPAREAVVKALELVDMDRGSEHFPPRQADAARLNRAIAEKTRQMSCAAVIAALRDRGVSASAVLSLEETETSAHFLARGLLMDTGAGRQVRFPVRLTDMPDLPTRSPDLGQGAGCGTGGPTCAAPSEMQD